MAHLSPEKIKQHFFQMLQLFDTLKVFPYEGKERLRSKFWCQLLIINVRFHRFVVLNTYFNKVIYVVVICPSQNEIVGPLL